MTLVKTHTSLRKSRGALLALILSGFISETFSTEHTNSTHQTGNERYQQHFYSHSQQQPQTQEAEKQRPREKATQASYTKFCKLYDSSDFSPKTIKLIKKSFKTYNEDGLDMAIYVVQYGYEPNQDTTNSIFSYFKSIEDLKKTNFGEASPFKVEEVKENASFIGFWESSSSGHPRFTGNYANYLIATFCQIYNHFGLEKTIQYINREVDLMDLTETTQHLVDFKIFQEKYGQHVTSYLSNIDGAQKVNEQKYAQNTEAKKKKDSSKRSAAGARPRQQPQSSDGAEKRRRQKKAQRKQEAEAAEQRRQEEARRKEEQRKQAEARRKEEQRRQKREKKKAEEQRRREEDLRQHESPEDQRKREEAEDLKKQAFKADEARRAYIQNTAHLVPAAYQAFNLPNGAPFKEIKIKYHKLAQSLHSDKNDDPNAEERFKELGNHYEVLKAHHRQEVYQGL